MGLGMGVELYRIALPGLLRQLGLGKWLRERGLHLPGDKMDAALQYANIELQKIQPGAPRITIATWRAVEATQAQILGEGITTRITPR